MHETTAISLLHLSACLSEANLQSHHRSPKLGCRWAC